MSLKAWKDAYFNLQDTKAGFIITLSGRVIMPSALFLSSFAGTVTSFILNPFLSRVGWVKGTFEHFLVGAGTSIGGSWAGSVGGFGCALLGAGTGYLLKQCARNLSLPTR